MIHRHKHEMTLKFPSIKNDNMLSGKSTRRLHHHRRARRGSRRENMQCVCRCVSWWLTSRHTCLSSEKLYGTAVPVVYSNVNHVTRRCSRYRDADVWPKCCQTCLSDAALCDYLRWYFCSYLTRKWIHRCTNIQTCWLAPNPRSNNPEISDTSWPRHQYRAPFLETSSSSWF